jgi:hypothetical protein
MSTRCLHAIEPLRLILRHDLQPYGRIQLAYTEEPVDLSAIRCDRRSVPSDGAPQLTAPCRRRARGARALCFKFPSRLATRYQILPCGSSEGLLGL